MGLFTVKGWGCSLGLFTAEVETIHQQIISSNKCTTLFPILWTSFGLNSFLLVTTSDVIALIKNL